MTIVTTHHRYKRPPGKRKAIALEVPAIVWTGKKDRHGETPDAAARVPTRMARPEGRAEENPSTPAGDDRKSAIVAARKPRATKHADFENLTEEESNRRADAAEAMWREMVRRATGKP